MIDGLEERIESGNISIGEVGCTSIGEAEFIDEFEECNDS
jgi:hypothetical protein